VLEAADHVPLMNDREGGVRGRDSLAGEL
jgi:hypothetical protein